MKEKKVIIITTIIAFVVICGLVGCSFLVFKENEKLRNSDTIYIVVKQRNPNGSLSIIYQEEFKDDLTYESVIESKISTGGHNTIRISNGECVVHDCNCPERTCEDYKILLRSKSIFSNNTEITCLPNGLYIYLSTSIE